MSQFLGRVKKRKLSQAPTTLDPDRIPAVLIRRLDPLLSFGTNKPPDGGTHEEGEKEQNLHVTIHHLPPELLVTIVQHDLSDPRYATSEPIRPKRAIRRVIMLSGVCSYWRQVVVETSSLWSLIPLFGGNPYQEPLTSLCMGRAKDSLLDIAILCDADSTGSDLVEGFTPQNHAHRIRSLRILAIAPEQLHAVLRFFESDGLNFLSELSVTFSPNARFSIVRTANILPTSQGGSISPRFIGLIQQLHVLDLTFVNLDWKQHSFNQLHTLKLTGDCSLLSLDQLVHVLSSSPQLQLLKIANLPKFTYDTVVDTSSISLPNLRYLHLYSLEFPVLQAILRAFPSGPYNTELLFHKGLDTADIDPSQRVAQLLALFPKFPNITALGMTPVLHPLGLVGWLPRVIRSVPNLNTLLLSDVMMNKYTISSLMPQSRGVRLVGPFPRITTLKLHNVRISAMQEFKDMVMSHPLARIELENCTFRFNLPPEGSRPFERWSTNPFITIIEPGSDFHRWLSKIIPKAQVSIIYGV